MAYSLESKLIKKGGLIFPSDLESLINSVKNNQNLYAAVGMKQAINYATPLPFGTIITLDGLSGAGKTSVGSTMAAYFSIPLLETGYIFKALAKKSETLGLSQYSSDENLVYAVNTLTLSDIMDEGLDGVGYAVLATSYATKSPAIRKAVMGKMKNIAWDVGNLILVGRDTGVTVFPQGSMSSIYLSVDDKNAAFRKIIQSEEFVAPSIMEKAVKSRNKADLANLKVSPYALHIDTLSMDESGVTLSCIHHIEKYFVKPWLNKNPQVKSSKFTL